MAFSVSWVNVSLSSFGCLTNFLTLLYILKRFDIRVHVFTLIFIDVIISLVSSLISVTLDAFVMGDLITVSPIYCHISFLTIWLPIFYGDILTFKVAFVRYYLTIKAARNIQVWELKHISQIFK